MAEAPVAPPQGAPGQPMPADVAGANRAEAPSPSPAPGAPSKAPAPAKGSSQGASAGSSENAKSASKTEKPTSEKEKFLIVYTGDMQMLVEPDGVPRAMDKIMEAAEAHGGHLAGRTNDTIKVKVPSERFREALSAIEKLGDVTAENVTAEDVTAEYHDLNVRLENLKATRKRLEEFLAKAGSIADMLTVERELERVAKEMDTIVGRLRFLSEHTAYSELAVHLTARPKPPPPTVAQPAATPAPPPPPRAINLPVTWFATLGIDQLFNLPSGK